MRGLKKIKIKKNKLSRKKLSSRYYSLFETTKEKFQSEPAVEAQSETQAGSYEIPILPVLKEMVKLAKPYCNFEKTLFVGCQHMLASTESLFNSLVELGAKPQNLHFVGKWYSSSTLIEKRCLRARMSIQPASTPNKLGYFDSTLKLDALKLWSKAQEFLDSQDIEGIIILDDGGKLLETVPKTLRFRYPIIGIEQTRGGLYNYALTNLPFPIIEVASSAAKKFLESPLIAEAVIERLPRLLDFWQKNSPRRSEVFGVIGNGAIGTAITNYLLDKGHFVLTYQNEEYPTQIFRHDKLFCLNNKRQVFANSHIIFGCTGQDITSDIDVLKELQGDTMLVSCSSGDIEFRELIRSLTGKALTTILGSDHLSYKYREGQELLIASHGFPFNFDRSTVSVASDKIALTRGLLLGGCIQAYHLMQEKKNNINFVCNDVQKNHMLNSTLQQLVLNYYPCIKNFDEGLQASFKNKKWIEGNSGGYNYNYSDLKLDSIYDPLATVDEEADQTLNFSSLK